MRRLLHVSASPHGGRSHSRRAGSAFAEALRLQGGIDTIVRDLTHHPLPYPNQAFAKASLMPAEARGPGDHAALSLSETLIAEIEAADMLLIDTPMHNFTLPAVLKTWVDHILRPGRTFQPSPQGKLALLVDRPTYLIVACGGGFEGSAAQPDWLTPYMRHALATIGLTSIEALRLENLRRGRAAIEAAERATAAWISAMIPSAYPKHQMDGTRS